MFDLFLSSRFGGIADIMSLTPDVNRKVGVGVAPSPSPFFTPRPERRRGPDPRGIDYGSNRLDEDKEVNVQVLVRCRCQFIYSLFSVWFERREYILILYQFMLFSVLIHTFVPSCNLHLDVSDYLLLLFFF